MTTYRGGVVLAQVVRSGFAESWHRGSYVVLDALGRVAHSAGDPDGAIFPRSANKPLQAAGMLRAGLRLADPAHLALVAASHSGEPVHIEGVRSMLRSASETDLLCPPDYPIGVEAQRDWLRAGRGAERVAMNCSGKHAGMLLTCLAAGWPVAGYTAPDHPLQKQLRATVEELAGEESPAVGVDGCGAPVFAMSLRALARSFLRVATAEPGTAEREVADAMRAYPVNVGGAGPEREDTRFMRGIPGLLAKGGAEAVMGVAIPGVGAVAVKLDDGTKRAIGPVTVGALRRLGVSAPVLDELATQPILGGGVTVGHITLA